MKQQLTLFFTPTELAAVRGISIHEVFNQIRSDNIPYLLDDEGIKIPVTYTWDDNQ